MNLSELGMAAGDLFLGASCHGCGGPGWGVCGGCRALLDEHQVRSTQPVPCPDGFPLTVTAGPYDEVTRQLIGAHKEDQALMLTGFLARRLATAVAALIAEVPRPVVLVPVPSASRAVRERGFDATHALARGAARRVRQGTPSSTSTVRPVVRVQRLLEQRRRLRDQAGLDAAERAANLAGGFRVRRRVAPGSVVVVVDDVVTTGASLTEAVRALSNAGVDVLGSATVAATVRRLPARLWRSGAEADRGP